MTHGPDLSAPPASPPGNAGSPARISPLASLLVALALAVALAFLFTSRESGPQTPSSEAPAVPFVGAEAFHTLVLPRGDLQAAPFTENTSLVVRVLSVRPAENQMFSYLLAYTGLEKGTFNLTDYLCRPDGERLREPITPVQVNSYLSDSAEYAIRNLPIPPHAPPLPYRALCVASAVVWSLAGLWMFWPAKTKRPPPAPTPVAPPASQTAHTLEDLLRPLVEKAAKKTISTGEKARLEQILFQYWGVFLELDHLNSVEQLRRILEHEDAGALLRTVEQWLYQPDSKIQPEEINRILRPYMDLPVSAQARAAEEEPEAPAFQS